MRPPWRTDRPGAAGPIAKHHQPYVGGGAVLANLKQILLPIKPVLGPIWGRFRPYLEGDRPLAIRRRPAGWLRITGGRLLSPRVRQELPIRALRESEFNAFARAVPYYKGRWRYMSVASAVVGDLIDTYRLTTALELGPHLQPVVVGADVLELVPKAEIRTTGQILVHDARLVPWPIGDKRYDLFVALQVFEHLGQSQRDAYREVCRIARHAVISVPIDWQMTDPKNCHHQISPATALSWFAPVVPTRVEVGNGGHRKRLIYIFEDLPAVVG